MLSYWQAVLFMISVINLHFSEIEASIQSLKFFHHKKDFHCFIYEMEVRWIFGSF